MAKPASRFVCQSCGAVTPKWAGHCEACGEWNSVAEAAIALRPGALGPSALAGAGARAPSGQGVTFVGLAGSAEPPPRAAIGIAELDRVLGGGLVPASVVLVGGDPGIGKSTLMLQAAARLARSGRRVLYVSGEEAIDQVRLRARRLGVADSPIELAAAINVRDIAASLEQAADTTLVVIELDPDDVAGRGRQRARQRGAGARLQLRADPAGQGRELFTRAGGPRHQGRRSGGSACTRAHGRRGAVFRRRPRASVPHSARGEKPLRRHR